MMEHKCDEMDKAEERAYGIAVNSIYFCDGSWWMTNDEYASGPIVCCPFAAKPSSSSAQTL